MKPGTLLGAAWGYRGFIVASVVNEFRTRLSRSKLGVVWLILHPLAQVLVFATILSKVLAARLEGIDNQYAYAVYLLAGIACWSLFSEVVLGCTTVFVDKASLLRKVSFPRITLPIVVVGIALVVNVCLVVVLVVVAMALGFKPSLAWGILPFLTLLTAALAAGIGLLLGTLHVFARDVGQAVGVALQFWFWATPIVYPGNIVPKGFARLLDVNPVVPLARAYHRAILEGKFPDVSLWWTVLVAAAFLLAALFVFRRASGDLVDAL